MKNLSETYKALGIDFTFPIEIKNADGKLTYREDDKGHWRMAEYNADGKVTYTATSTGWWRKSQYDDDGNETYYENKIGVKRGTPRSQ